MEVKELNNTNVKKKLAAGISIASNTGLILLKIVVGIISGSISIISEALHSLADLLASFIAFFSVMKSSEPADDDHPFGHGKYEDLAGFVEAILIILTSFYIFYVAGEKLIHHSHGTIETTPAIAVMVISIVVNFIVSRYLFYVAKKTDSIALCTDAEHLSMDIYSSVAILLGLVAIKFTGLHILDPIFAIVVAALILRTGMSLTKQAANSLLDGALPEEDKEKIKKVLDDFKEKGLKGVKSVNTSKSGSKRVIQLTIFLPCEMSLKATHHLCDEIEENISKEFDNFSVIIHAEPNCTNEEEKCLVCEYKKMG